jgi:dTDP-4-amino-4,6-dideoxygalactose transaminase
MNATPPYLTKGPEQRDRHAANLIFTVSAGSAWREILRRIARKRGRPARLLMPAYIGQSEAAGSGIFDPVRDAQASYTFYPVLPNLVPDLDTIALLLDTTGFDALLLVHWFGFVQVDLAGLKALCDRRGVMLVEDCAHCLYGSDQLPGRTGDYAYYSIHKMYPTGSGGILRQNAPGAAPEEPHHLDACDPAALEQVIRTDRNAVITRRRENYRYLWEQIARIPQLERLWVLDASTTPHNFPLYVRNGQREDLYFHLRERGFPTIALYHRMIDELDREQFPVSFEISERILNLPVHQDTDIADLQKLVMAIGAYFG